MVFLSSSSNVPRLSTIRKVPSRKLFVSEPPPQWFGNGPNAANDPAWSNKNWLKSRFHFSFAEYASGPQQFGVLRVMNDDLVQPHRAFGTHPHRDMEIVTYVVDGELTHKDTEGNEETLGRGSVQFMSAGTGIMHSEGNPQGDKPLRFVQSWITPRAYGLEPNYGSATGTDCDRKDQWCRVVADWNDPTASDVKVRVHQDVNGYAAETSKELEFELAEGRQAYCLCVEGAVTVCDDAKETSLERHDAVELYGPLKLRFQPKDTTHLLMYEMAADARGSGRRDAEDA
ncbi:hypothetical protein CTAYLR_009471 [Chrysophaeum taylorii]|uniref:Pirin n=1 Tax=Chrysophaeum taylorii TaxID=2483200 RepID=A0AAD7XF55_9STRA|nr:hypothetical protein CTAYLR_009471 [Chrysophaeum taylorii]